MAAPEEGEFLQGLRPGDGDASAVALVLALQLARGGKRIVFDDDGTEEHRAQDGDGVLRAVRHDEGDAITRAHARLVEGSRGLAHLLNKFRVRELACEEVNRGALGVAGGDFQDHVRDRTVGNRDVVGDSRCVQFAQLRREIHLSSFGNDAPTIP